LREGRILAWRHEEPLNSIAAKYSSKNARASSFIENPLAAACREQHSGRYRTPVCTGVEAFTHACCSHCGARSSAPAGVTEDHQVATGGKSEKYRRHKPTKLRRSKGESVSQSS